MASTMAVASAAPAEIRALAAERKSISLVASAHLVSHFNMLVTVSMFPLLRSRLNVSFVELGSAIVVFNVVSVLAQTPTGMLVDKVGPRKLLIGALILAGLCFIAFGLFPSYPTLLVSMGIIGLANSVFHPADYDLLNSVVAPSRVGRAFSYHTFSGYLGSGMAPPLLIFIASQYGMSAAYLTAGSIGVLVAIPLMFATQLDRRRPTHNAEGVPIGRTRLRSLLTPAILSLTLFFIMLNLSLSGLQNFSIVALHAADNIPLTLASIALTLYLIGVACGVLTGGIIADKTTHHSNVAIGGFACCALFTLCIAVFHLNGYVAAIVLGAAGFCSGMIMPSRDMLVRAAAPPGAMGRTFGIVTTGFNIGGAIGPMTYGWLMDRGEPRAIFYCAFVLMLLTACMPLVTEWWRKRGILARGDIPTPA